MVRHLTVDVESADGQLAEEMTALARDLAWDSIPTIGRSPITDFTGFDAILSVGSSGRRDLPWTVVNSNGWAARVSSRGKDLSGACGQANAIGALGAACLGTADVFKRLIELRPEAGELHDRLFFSFRSYRTDDDPGPEIIGPLDLDFLLVGAGAIGNGIIHLLGALPITGRVNVVDKQAYASENWGTCILVERRHEGHAKATVAQDWLAPKLEAKPYHETIEAFLERCGKDVSWPRLVVGALDNPEARRSIQRLWPDQIIDGAIGPTSCGVTLHPWGPDLSCLLCDFTEPSVDSTALQREATGLSAERLANMSLLVSDEDVCIAPPEKRDWLRQQVGRPMCSVVQDGVLALIAGRAQTPGFEPSVPFVACLSSCMVVSELVRYATSAPAVLQTGFQFSVLYGPKLGFRTDHERKRDCLCVARRASIETVRQGRGLGNVGQVPVA
jgi:hypothetical protein